MKILHLMTPEKFLKGTVAFYNRFFSNGEHTICYVHPENEQSLVDPSLSITQTDFYLKADRLRNAVHFLNLSRDYDFIVIHYFLTWEKISRFLFFLPKKYYKKLVWIEWGVDLYERKSGFREKLADRVKANVHAVAAIFPPDAEVYKQRFPKSEAKVFYAPYRGGADVDPEYKTVCTTSMLREHRETGQPITVQIGQNQKPTLNHIEVLKVLEKFRDENIRIFLPLSYGGSEAYADRVQAEAERMFPGKTVILRKMMERDAYYNLLNSVDIAIFNTMRQAALGNIHRLLWHNTKIYFPRESVMYRYFVSRGAPVCAFEDIAGSSWEEFLSDPQVRDEEEYRRYRGERASMDDAVARWTAVYDSLREDLKETE